jgi:hypothetical protein
VRGHVGHDVHSRTLDEQRAESPAWRLFLFGAEELPET